MTLKISFSAKPPQGADTIVLCVYDGRKPGSAALALDAKTGGLIRRALKTAKKFNAKPGETLAVALPAKAGFAQAILLGLGKASALDARQAENAGGRLAAALGALGPVNAVLAADRAPGFKGLGADETLARIATGALLRSYSFDKYKTDKNKKKPSGRFSITGAGPKAASLFRQYAHVADGVFRARDLVNEPPNLLYPQAYAETVRRELSPLGVEVTILDEKKMKALGMGAIMAVGQGSARPPRMVILHWNGGRKKSAKNGQDPLAIVGKGMTFDTGGISIKPAAGMDEMKMDMGGSAAVVGTIRALALRKSKANVVGIIGIAENMPSGNAYRPGDIITSYAGKTIEVLNTDAEGRLVLADCLTYVQRKYKPKAIIDLATLTGAILVALGDEYCGTFVNNDKLWHQLEKASAATGEKLWRMPLDEAWRKEVESSVADLQNIGQTGRNAGACTAAGFLEHFIEGGTPWAHLDIAGTAWIKKDRPTVPRQGTGFGVRLLDALIAENYE